MAQRTVIVLAGGSRLTVPLPGPLPDGATVIAADAGIDRGLALGLAIDRAIGDFDSVSARGLAATEAAGATVERHPAAKDATDLELALDAAIALEPDRILVLGSAGGRLDHLLGSVLLLADVRYAAAAVDAYLDSSLVAVIRGTRNLTGRPGDIVSLVPAHGPAEGVTTAGLEYPLLDERLSAGTSRGISNVFITTEARITVAHGCLIAIRPGPEPAGSS